MEDKKYPKGSIIKSKKYTNRKDLLNVLLKEGSLYSLKEVDKLIDDFMKRSVR